MSSSAINYKINVSNANNYVLIVDVISTFNLARKPLTNIGEKIWKHPSPFSDILALIGEGISTRLKTVLTLADIIEQYKGDVQRRNLFKIAHSIKTEHNEQ